MVEGAVAAGARREAASEAVGLSARTLERWRSGKVEDERRGPKKKPANALSEAERKRFVDVANTAEFRDLSPHQIVPRLADRGEYLGSESTLFRLLRERDMLHHRERSKARASRRPDEHVATGPCEVWSWDITYLRRTLRGAFFYLYLVLDVWSRKIVAWEVHEREDDALSSELMARTARELGIDLTGLVLHSDNGGPMKGATMVTTLEKLGILPSFSRPSTSDDNPYSEALFRTLKYRPEYPRKPFDTIDDARAWVEAFVRWYNTEHRHSGIGFVTPEERHSGLDVALLAHRHEVYERACGKNPERWARHTRNWSRIERVSLNPSRREKTAALAAVVTATEPERRSSHPQGRSEAEEARPRAFTGPARRLRPVSHQIASAADVAA
jgi:transposase InsO family protein